jgi:hypothetical protein
VSLRRVLEDCDSVRIRQFDKIRDRRRVPEDVNGQQGPGPFADHGLSGRRGHAPGVGIDVAEHRDRADHGNGLGGGEEGERGYDHLVARPHPKRTQRDCQGIGAIGDTDAVRCTDVARELRLEPLHFGSEDVAPTMENSALAVRNLG